MRTLEQEHKKGGADMARSSSNLSRRARTILAMDALLLSAGDDPGRITKEGIATKAAEWTTDEVSMFGDGDEFEYDDYYSIISSLMHIVHAMRGGDA